MHAIPAVNNDLIRISKWCSHNSLRIPIKLLVAGLRQLISQLPANYSTRYRFTEMEIPQRYRFFSLSLAREKIHKKRTLKISKVIVKNGAVACGST